MPEITDYYTAFRQEAGLTLSDALCLAAMEGGIRKFNADLATPIVLSGTTTDRTLNEREIRYLILSAVYVHLTRRMIETSENAIVVSNVAGKTDLTGIELALSKRRKEIAEQDLPLLKNEIENLAVAGDVFEDELGETLEFSRIPHPTPWPPEI